MSAPVRAAIGLGGNLGDASATLRDAFEALDRLPGTRLLRASPLYRTPAWGNTDQPDFVNAAVLVETTLAARALLDVLLYGDAAIDEPGLRVPHPHLHERAFALLPLADIAPEWVVPGHGSVATLLAAVDARACVEAGP